MWRFRERFHSRLHLSPYSSAFTLLLNRQMSNKTKKKQQQQQKKFFPFSVLPTSLSTYTPFFFSTASSFLPVDISID